MADRIAELEQKIQKLQHDLTQATGELCALRGEEGAAELHDNGSLTSVVPSGTSKWPLSMDEYKRYSRQLIMPEVGSQGQLRLRCSSALIVGLGGLGSPACAYLAGAGVGTLGLLDGDTVSMSNLHRQIIHTTSSADRATSKVDSAASYVQNMNPHVKLVKYNTFLTPQNAVEIIEKYGIVLDCTDTAASRYLVNDACVIAGRPLIFGSALQTNGQLMVLNDPPLPAGTEGAGPCYRCIFPVPPPVTAQQSCSESGILGPVVGTIGVLMALEAIKLLVRPPPTTTAQASPKRTMLNFTAMAPVPFMSIKLRQTRKPDCVTCSASASIKRDTLGTHHDASACAGDLSILAPHERLSAQDLASRIESAEHGQSTVIDLREKPHFSLYSLPNSINIPWSEMEGFMSSRQFLERLATTTNSDRGPERGIEALRTSDVEQGTNHTHPGPTDPGSDITLICALGNDSQLGVRHLRQLGIAGEVNDVAGGWRAWRLMKGAEGEDAF